MDDLAPKIVEEEIGIPTNLASFKLDLQDNEKKAKEELILPYTLYVNYFSYVQVGCKHIFIFQSTKYIQ